MPKPQLHEYPELYHPFVQPIPYDDLIMGLEQSFAKSLQVLQRITDTQGLHRYEPNKWSIKELMGHLIDCERIYCYRALSIARGEKIALPGFDQDAYVKQSNAESRSMRELVEELIQVRKATVLLFKSFTPQQLTRKGTANGFEMSVNLMGFIAIGHVRHHVKVIQEKYL
ncbi:MAG: DinB family protein [Flammeovirgaceae bacterium]